MSAIRIPAQATRPSVGPFWGLSDSSGRFHILAVTTELVRAESYGDCLTDTRGHAELWNQWQTLNPRELKARDIPIGIKEHQYDYWPRGRVVYEVPTQCFVIYADPRLLRHSIVARVRITFALTGNPWRHASDDHYRSISDEALEWAP